MSEGDLQGGREMAHKLMTGAHNIPTAYEAWENAMGQVGLCGEYYRYQVNARYPEAVSRLVKQLEVGK